MKKLFSCFLTLMITSSLVMGQDLKQQVQQIANQYKAVGVAYVVVKDGQIIHKDAIGKSSLENNTPLDVDYNIFRIASISKSFTATALMQLIEQKRISLDDDMSDLVGFRVRNPHFPDTKITLGMVLSHTSSINDFGGYFELDVINPSKGEYWQESYNKYEPGTDYMYCNLNFNMAGAVLERLVQVRFDEYIKQQILDPLDLYGGYNVDSLDALRFTSLYTYDPQQDKYILESSAYVSRSKEIAAHQIGVSTPIFSPTGGMKISAVDLAKYMIMHMNYGQYTGQRILSEASSKLMQSKRSEQAGYGLALQETEKIIKNEHLVGHTGSAYGMYSSMFFSPEKKYGIVVITNGCEHIFSDGELNLTTEITNLLYDKLIR